MVNISFNTDDIEVWPLPLHADKFFHGAMAHHAGTLKQENPYNIDISGSDYATWAAGWKAAHTGKIVITEETDEARGL